VSSDYSWGIQAILKVPSTKMNPTSGQVDASKLMEVEASKLMEVQFEGETGFGVAVTQSFYAPWLQGFPSV